MEVSGSTITYTENIFPLKNIPILKMNVEDETSFTSLKDALAKKRSWFKEDDGFSSCNKA